MAGRKPKPTAVKRLEGNPGKRKLNAKEPNSRVAICNTEQQLMMQAASEFGLTPSARSRIMAASGVGKDEDFAAVPRTLGSCSAVPT